MKSEELNKKRMEEIENLLNEKESKITSLKENIQAEMPEGGGYGYDFEEVKRLKSEMEKTNNEVNLLKEEYSKLEKIPTKEKIERDIKALSEQLAKIKEEQKEFSGSYYPTEELIDLMDQEKDVRKELNDRQELKGIVDQIETAETEIDELKKEIKQLEKDRDTDYQGAYFIPDEVNKEIQDKKNILAEKNVKLKDLKQQFDEKTNNYVEIAKEDKEEPQPVKTEPEPQPAPQPRPQPSPSRNNSVQTEEHWNAFDEHQNEETALVKQTGFAKIWSKIKSLVSKVVKNIRRSPQERRDDKEYRKDVKAYMKNEEKMDESYEQKAIDFAEQLKVQVPTSRTPEEDKEDEKQAEQMEEFINNQEEDQR